MSTRSSIAHSIASAARAKVDLPPPCAGEAPDRKPPLRRSDDALNEAAAELLKLLGCKARRVRSVCAIEQGFFLIDRGWHGKRADLMLAGRALVGAPPPKDRLETARAGAINERALSYMHDVCAEAFRLGVPVTAYRGESAPGLYTFAPSRERAGLAADHNMLLIDAMNKVAARHNLACLPHEKPFAGIDGCGKSVGWSLADDNGNNLFNPGGTAEENLFFLALVVSVINAAHRHGGLLLAAAASAGNEERLGAVGAPPAVISVSLGEELAKVIAALEAGKTEKGKKRELADLGGLPPKFAAGAADGGRASPIAFAGDNFEFRLPGGPMNAATTVTVINTIIADSMKAVCERIKKEIGKGRGDKHAAAAVGGSAAKGADESGDGGRDQNGDADPRKQEITAAVMNALAAVIKESKPVLSGGGGRLSELAQDAPTGAPQNAAPAHEAVKAFAAHEAVKAFAAPEAAELFGRHNVYSEAELTALYNDWLDQYNKTIDCEVKTLAEMVNTQILPSAYNYQTDIASGLEVLRVLADDMTIEMADGALEDRKEMFEKLTADIYNLRKSIKELAAMADKSRLMAPGERAAYLFKEIKPQMSRVRRHADALEGSMPDETWPLPKYKEMLFIL